MAVAAGFNPSANQRAFARRNEAQGATISISSQGSSRQTTADANQAKTNAPTAT